MGNALLYQTLAGCLPGVHVLGIDDPKFGKPHEHFQTLPDMATCYAELIIGQGFQEPYQASTLLAFAKVNVQNQVV